MLKSGNDNKVYERKDIATKVLDLLGKNEHKEGIPDMPFATQLEVAKEAGHHAENMWLDQRGYNTQRYHEILSDIKSGEFKPGAAEPVTATVKQPKFVRRTVEALRAKGMNDAAAAIEALPPDRQMAEAGRSAGMLRSRTGVVPEKAPVNPRLDKGG